MVAAPGGHICHVRQGARREGQLRAHVDRERAIYKLIEAQSVDEVHVHWVPLCVCVWGGGGGEGAVGGWQVSRRGRTGEAR